MGVIREELGIWPQKHYNMVIGFKGYFLPQVPIHVFKENGKSNDEFIHSETNSGCQSLKKLAFDLKNFQNLSRIGFLGHMPIFSRVLRDSISRYVGPSVGWSVHF